MSNLDSNQLEKYDKCNDWLDEQRKEKDLSWDDIREGRFLDEYETLTSFLKSHCKHDNWPDFSEESWRNYITDKEKACIEQIRISKEEVGELPDSSKSNALYAPHKKESCWQHYLRYLKDEKQEIETEI